MPKTVRYFKTVMKNVEEKGDVIAVSGYGSTKDVDRGNDKVLPTAFTETVDEAKRTSGIAMLLGHDDGKVIGGWQDFKIDTKGLFMEGEVKYDIDGCMEKIKNGDLRGLSIGYIVKEFRFEDSAGHIMYTSENGMEAGYDYDDLYKEDAIRVISKLELFEVSVVATPMNPFSFLSSVKEFFAEEVKAMKAMHTAKKTDDDGGEEDPAKVDPPAPEKTETEGKEDEPEPAKTIPDETAAPMPAPIEKTPEEIAAEQAAAAPEGGTQTETNASDAGNAGGNPAPTPTPGEEADAAEKSAQVEALEKAADGIKTALLAEVEPLIAASVKSAVELATQELTAENTALKEVVSGLKTLAEASAKALGTMEAVPGGFVPHAEHKNLIVTDAMVLKTLGQRG